MRVKLTKTILEREHAAIVAAGTGRKIIWDTGDVVGFGARLSPGRVVLFLNYRSGGVERRMTVARLGECTIEQARKRAAELKLQIRAGLDPLATLREARPSGGVETHHGRVGDRQMAQGQFQSVAAAHGQEISRDNRL